MRLTAGRHSLALVAVNGSARSRPIQGEAGGRCPLHLCRFLKTRIDPFVSRHELPPRLLRQGSRRKRTLARIPARASRSRLRQPVSRPGGQQELIDRHALGGRSRGDGQNGRPAGASRHAHGWTARSAQDAFSSVSPTPMIGTRVSSPRAGMTSGRRSRRPSTGLADGRSASIRQSIAAADTHEMLIQGMSDLHLKIYRKNACIGGRDKVDIIASSEDPLPRNGLTVAMDEGCTVGTRSSRGEQASLPKSGRCGSRHLPQ